MTKLYFIRHGKTEWNLEGRYQGGQGDSPLLPQSYRDIASLGHYLSHIKFARLYTSPLLRAKMTAVYLKEALGQDFPIIINENLREFNLGKMEGMKFTEVAQRFPKELAAFRHEPANYNPARISGETFQALIDRMQPVVKKAVRLDKTGQQNILFVSHGAALVALIQSLLGTPIANIRKNGGLTNSSVTIIKTQDHGQKFQLVKWNDTEFLKHRLNATDTI
ncbi:histidine phosphatase family protein [Agrilactobacillus fermenti]|uniref:histidine phosphatase family protein n=1 Tax=Agrilactobacillus fermenti TaxID=2586909 RepID=UPI001E4BC64B|nr:histidine phosphatase family protein [Agrilactobacillus fermenti]MCD2255292.1 histidine phosphatase family protein [Agrilactobacillus fermenti]